MKLIDVELKEKSYKLTIEKSGFLKLGAWARSLFSLQKLVLITDDRVGPLYGQQAKKMLEAEGFKVHCFEFPAGEASKNLTTAKEAWDFLTKKGLTKTDGVLALGGGVVGDLAAFVASTYMRGIHFLQVPTSLTAQVDASIGGKTGVNTPDAKNIIGSIAQPAGVLIDPELLRTLDDRALTEGMGEVIKCALIADSELWKLLARFSYEELLENAEAFIVRACQIKASFVSKDVSDSGERLKLNFGHTIGHAIEQVTGYEKIMHGEAVALGMLAITKAAERQGISEVGLTAGIAAMLKNYHLPTEFPDLNRKELLRAITHDKKQRSGQLNLIVVPKIGEALIYPIASHEMEAFL